MKCQLLEVNISGTRVMIYIVLVVVVVFWVNCFFFCNLRGEPFDRGLVHAIESVIIEWTHQIQGVLKRNSAQPLLEGHNPGPLVELDFWRARATNLECIFEQVCQ